MSNIINFPRHYLVPWTTFEGDDTGLCSCSRCGGAEGSLPEDCPGVLMTEKQQELVLAGKVDFRRKMGGWTGWTRAKEMHVRGLVT